jgi:hypothetical protein
MTLSTFRAAPVFGALLVAFALAQAAGAEGWGTIQGKVVFDGPVPKREKLDIVHQDKAKCEAKGPLFSDVLIVNPKNKGIKNAVVFLIDASGDPTKPLPVNPKDKAPTKDEEIDQPCCQFIPRVLAIREGQGLVFKNSAAMSHNVHVLGGRWGPEFNVLLPPDGAKRVDAKELPARPRHIVVKCDIHGWMGAAVWVFDHPYYAVTDEDGKFRIKDAPAGNWRIVVWQESKGWVNGSSKGQPITIKDGATTDLEFKLTPSKD